MVEITQIEIGQGTCLGIKVGLRNAPLLLVVAPEGFVMCGYLNLETAEVLGDAACVVKGVKDFEELLTKPVSGVTPRAKERGIKEGMAAKDALLRLF